MSNVGARRASRLAAPEERAGVSGRQRRLLASGAGLGAAAVLPLATSDYGLTLATEVMIAAIFATGLNILIGYTGLVSLGNAMFVGLGGYGIAIGSVLLGWPLWVSVPVTLVSVGLFAAGVGAICTRTRGVEFLLITLAFSQMIYGAAIKLRWTNGSDGMSGIPRPDLAWMGLSSDDPLVFYFYVLSVAAGTLFILWRIVRSPFGSVLSGIRENEQRLVAMGYRVSRYKIGAFVVAALAAAVAGVLQAQYTYFINPDAMGWQFSGEGVLMVNMGGRQAFLGPLVGAGFFVVVKQALSGITDEYLIFFGLFFMVVVAFFQGGIIGFLQKLLGGRP
jgi:branched-chain amino acid transport system permease protein